MTLARTLLLSIITALPLMATASAAQAAGAELAFNAGAFNALRSDDQAFQFGAEYRFAPVTYGVRPVVGGFATSDNSAYGYVGLNWDVELIKNQLYIIPNFAVGAYREGDGKDLGGALEFRSGIEIDYQLPNEHRIGVTLNHLSNASIYDKNPGEESILAVYSIPISKLF
jgi:opacity protein-like surface antigen